MNFCSSCGEAVVFKIPEGDAHTRYVCTACGTIHYQNPKIVTGCLVTKNDEVLLCKRGIMPRRGLWTFPAGFLELQESTQDGAIRETREEACCDVEIQGLYTLFDLPYISQIYMFYRANLTSDTFAAGVESADVRLFSEASVPWEELAFPVVKRTLDHFFEDRQTDSYPFHSETIRYRPPRSTSHPSS